jgi:magnesium transporter
MTTHLEGPGRGKERDSIGFYRSADGTVQTVAAANDRLIREALADRDGLLWIDLSIADPSDGRLLKEVFDFHPLTIEDAVEPRVDPAKIDDLRGYIFVVVQALTDYSPDREIETVEVDFYLGPNYVVSCHREIVPAIDTFRERCRRTDYLLGHTADWLLYNLLDAMVDEYLPLVDRVDETIDDIESRVLASADRGLLREILLVKRNTLRLRRATTPQRDILNRLSRGEFPHLIREGTSIYFRDVYDHLFRVEYLVEALRDLADGALQTYLSVVSNRLNEIVKALTVGATIILPLTLISGVYGMNFQDNQFPAFGSDWGFAAVIASMLAIALMILAYFRYRRWI